MPSQLLKTFLDENDIKYISIMHSMAFTAVEVAKSSHIPSRELAKTVIINVDNELAMAVVPANYKVNLDILRQTLGTPKVKLAEEAEFTPRFKDCEVGAMPPFGAIYEVPLYMYEGFDEDSDIAFRAGSHHEIIKMQFSVYKRLAHPMTLTEGFAKIGMKKPDWLARRKAS